jgi:excisionase family DNA binding protein
MEGEMRRKTAEKIVADMKVSEQAKARLIDDLMDIPTAAQRLGGVSPWTVRAWLKAGRIAKTKVGARTMVSAAALEQFLEDCRG